MRERVARGDLAAIEPFAEPRHPLLRRAMCKRIGAYVPGGLFLQTVVTNRRRGAQRRINIACSSKPRCWVVWPKFPRNSPLAIPVSPTVDFWPRILLHHSLFLALDAQNFLYVMADLVRQHVGLRKLPRGAEALLQLIVKTQVDVNFFVLRAIKRPGGRFRTSAARLNGIAK